MDTSKVDRWKSGDIIVLRGVSRHIIWWACSAFIVKDSPELVAVYWPAGTPNMIPVKRTSPRDLLLDEIQLVPQTWIETDVLMLVPNGASHAIYAMRKTGQPKLLCWYINLQEPLRRTKLGFDSMDHLLDIVISPDRSTWHWKDEDEFDEAVKLGVFSLDEVNAIRIEGERAVQSFRPGNTQFYEHWENWHPPSKWGIPPLLGNWNDIEE